MRILAAADKEDEKKSLTRDWIKPHLSVTTNFFTSHILFFAHLPSAEVFFDWRTLSFEVQQREISYTLQSENSQLSRGSTK